MVQAEEAERARIAGDVHDGPLQKALILAGGVTNTANEQKNLAQQLVFELREICSRLRPAILDDLGIVPALEWLLSRMTQQSGFNLALTLRGVDEEERFSQDTELALFRVAQEAANNAIKHSKGTSLDVSLSKEADSLILKIADDGTGFVRTSRASNGFGLSGMRERAIQVGGSLEISSLPGFGTTVVATIPVT